MKIVTVGGIELDKSKVQEYAKLFKYVGNVKDLNPQKIQAWIDKEDYVPKHANEAQEYEEWLSYKQDGEIWVNNWCDIYNYKTGKFIDYKLEKDIINITRNQIKRCDLIVVGGVHFFTRKTLNMLDKNEVALKTLYEMETGVKVINTVRKDGFQITPSSIKNYHKDYMVNGLLIDISRVQRAYAKEWERCLNGKIRQQMWVNFDKVSSHETQKKMTIVTVGGMIGVGR